MTLILDILLHLKFIPTRELRVKKEDAKGLVRFSGTFKGMREVCFVLIFLTIGRPLPTQRLPVGTTESGAK